MTALSQNASDRRKVPSDVLEEDVGNGMGIYLRSKLAKPRRVTGTGVHTYNLRRRRTCVVRASWSSETMKDRITLTMSQRESRMMTDEQIDRQLRILERGQRTLTRSTMIPFQQAMEIQWNVGEMVIRGLELNQSLQRMGADMTRTAFRSYLDSFEDFTRRMTHEAQGAPGESGHQRTTANREKEAGSGPQYSSETHSHQPQRQPMSGPVPPRRAPPQGAPREGPPQQQVPDQQASPKYEQRGPSQQGTPPEVPPGQQPPPREQRGEKARKRPQAE